MTDRPLMRARLTQASESRLEVTVEGPHGTGVLEYVSPDPVWHAPPPNLDFAAVALVQYAASEGCDLHLEGPVTSTQLERLEEFQLIWSVWRPDKFQRITLRADDEVGTPELPGRAGAVMGFSGGVDASFALAAHHTGDMGRLTREIDLGVLIVGWDLKHGDQPALDRAREAAKRQLDAYGVGQAVVSTNWQQDFCNAWFMAFNTGLMSILHTFSGEYSSAVHANDRSYIEELRLPPFGSNLAINHLLGTPWFPVVTTGGTHRRIERVAYLADHPALLEGMRVCYQAGAGGTNCGHCQKCVLTQLERRAVGIPADQAFPDPMTLADVRALTIDRPHVAPHFEDVLAGLPEDDEMREPLREVVEGYKLARAPRIRQLTETADRLEQQVQQARQEVADLHASRSWQVTRPLRAATSRLRARRG